MSRRRKALAATLGQHALGPEGLEEVDELSDGGDAAYSGR